LVKEKAPNLAE